MVNEDILKIQSVSKSFGGICALNEVSFNVFKGEIFSLIGPNGAGKTTMFNCITKIYIPDNGRILFMGKDLIDIKPHQICKLGIARTFQNVELFSNLTVTQNIMIGLFSNFQYGLLSSLLRTKYMRSEEKKHKFKVEKIIEFLGLSLYKNLKVSNLPFGIQKIVELGRALILNPKLLLLDEPVSGMNQEEKNTLAKILLEIKKNINVTILLVEHDMNFVMNISDRICVLNFGKKIAEGTPEEVRINPKVIEAYLGRET